MNYTNSDKNWLDSRYMSGVAEDNYHSHQPIYGFNKGNSEIGHISRIARVFHLLKILNKIDFNSCLDIGGGEGYLSHLIDKAFGVKGYNSDISHEACLRAKELFNTDSATLNASALPFKDNSFDVVICSEVIEHLEFPVFAMKELLRVAKKYVLISTVEIEPFALNRNVSLYLRDLDAPHAERNFYHLDDFKALYGNDIKSYGQHRIIGDINEESLGEAEAKVLIKNLVNGIKNYDYRYNGVIVLKSKINTDETSPKLEDDKILDLIFSETIKTEHQNFSYHEGINSNILAKIICPACNSEIRTTSNSKLECKSCNMSYSVNKGVPELFVSKEFDEKDLNSYFNKKYVKNLHRKLSSANIVTFPLLKRLLYAYKRQSLNFLRKNHVVNV